jgi:hypothetical protein
VLAESTRARFIRDGTDEVLEVPPDLHQEGEDIEDLHSQADAPFLVGTQNRLWAEARDLIERRPGLAYYFDDLVPANASSGKNSRETELAIALEANLVLRVQAELMIAAYVAPESDRTAITDELIMLLEGPQQCEAQMLAVEALGDMNECDGLDTSRLSCLSRKKP